MTRQRYDLREGSGRVGAPWVEPVSSGTARGGDHALALDLVRVTEAAAIAAGRWVGHGADRAGEVAAAEAVREYLGCVPMRGVVVLGDEPPAGSPVLPRGIGVGDGTGPECDVGIAAGEATLSAARDVPHAITAIAVTERGGMYSPQPETSMQKLAVGAACAGVVDIRMPVAENVRAIADATGSARADVTVAVLDRPRHRRLVQDVREAGARVHLLEGGEIAGAVAAAHPDSPIDVLLGTGSGADGVLAAAALSCLGGSLQAVLRPEGAGSPESTDHAVDRVLRTEDLVRGDRILFCATGVTGNELLRGVGRCPECTTTDSTVMCSDPATVRSIRSEHRPAVTA
ncbi:fructose-bisphosphatase class II [Prauserella rugosa]|uniref:Fructose-1,6-bisphosphatase n=1 Tax=Prauserella rugosa TaxID=43354 RepID=A0A660CAA3_9PSEU|nr:fructose-bisphosphatase class II [Prauserella rugosa]TWH20540.1 fructose-1,6-bisphosphatase II [Prauserella rugosa]